MSYKFSHYYDLPLTMVFEEQYEENLQIEGKTKQEFIDAGMEFIYLIDGDTNKLIGETYFAPIEIIREVDPNLVDLCLKPYEGKNAVYCYSNTILPEYQGKGYATILKSYLLGYLKAKNFNFVLGNARRNGSIQLNKKFGAKIVASYDNWCGSDETVDLYIQTL